MLELFSLIFGGALRLAPELIKVFTAGKEADHEYRMSKLQLDIDQARAKQQIDLVNAQSEADLNKLNAQSTADLKILQQQALKEADASDAALLSTAIQAQSKTTGIPWIDALSSSVRPVLTYWWCLGLYTAYKACLVISLYIGNATWREFAGTLVTEFDQMIIASIFSFWFVDRSIRKSKG